MSLSLSVCVCERVTIALTWTGLKRGTRLKLELHWKRMLHHLPQAFPLSNEICLGTFGKIHVHRFVEIVNIILCTQYIYVVH